MTTPAILQLHLEPRASIEVRELTDALSALSHQYDSFIKTQSYIETASKARLLISSVSPGSIDINFIPDIHAAISTIAPVVTDVQVVGDFAKHLGALINQFRTTKDHDGISGLTVRDCEDVISIVHPIAEHGGSQTFNVFNGPVAQHIHLSSSEADLITQNAIRLKNAMQFPEATRFQRVPMIWKRMDRDPAKSQGRTPDKALISEIDDKPKSVFFSDELSYLKDEMLRGDENPLLMVYYVDVEISRVETRIVSYRIVGYHGKEEIEDIGR